MNRLRFTGVFPATACSALVDLLVDAAQRPSGPVGLVLVVDDLVAAAAVRPGRPGLGEDVPVGDVLAGVLAAPLRDQVGDVRDLRAEDERQARGLDRLLVRLGHHAGIGDDGHVGQLVRGHERLDDRQHRLGLGPVALERGHHEREPVGAGEQADGDLRLQPPLLGEPALAEPVALIGLEVESGARRRAPGWPGRARRARRRPRRSAAARSPSRTRAAAA